MNWKLLGALSALMMPLSVLAADLPVKAPANAPVSTVYNWTGFYAGGHVGYDGTNARHDRSPVAGGPVDTESLSLDGVEGGIQGGYLFQTGPLVFGIESDFGWSSASTNPTYTCPAASCVFATTYNYTAKNIYGGTIRGRFGYAFDNWLPYVTGGWAYGQSKSEGTATVLGVATPFSTTHNTTGWTVGGGIENAFAPSWSWKLEYLYTQINDDTSAAAGVTTVAKANSNAIRLGVNYHFK
jgi:outer membrane immunogenic protein